MNWKWMPIVAGIVLCQLVWGAQARGEDAEDGAGVFRPVEEGEQYDTLFGEQGGTAGEVFGPARGHVHPFLSLSGFYTSNLFNTDDQEDQAIAAVVSPGIWLAFPASRQQLAEVETLNTSPGGLEVSRFRTPVQRRLQGYALYRYDHTEYDYVNIASAPDTTDQQRAELMGRYNLRGGLSLELLNIFEDDHDPYSTGNAEAGELDTFKANMFNPSLAYRVSPKTRLALEYIWYVLDYDPARRSFRDREDHIISGTVFYKVTPRTSGFIDYDYITVDFDESGEDDSDEHRAYVGIQRRVSTKSRARLKLGYGERQYDRSGEDNSFFVAEVQLDHRFNRKSSLFLKASRKANQPDIQGAQQVLAERLRLGYSHEMTAKITGNIRGFYYRNEYDGAVIEGNQTGERTDDRYGGELALGYLPKRWLNLSAGYVYTERDSNFDTRDYRTHTLFVNVTAQL